MFTRFLRNPSKKICNMMFKTKGGGSKAFWTMFKKLQIWWRRAPLTQNHKWHRGIALTVFWNGWVRWKDPFHHFFFCVPIRPDRCIVTIASLDQWLATIEKHCHQWLADWKTIEEPLVPMIEQVPFHQWQWSPKKPLICGNDSNCLPFYLAEADIKQTNDN